MYSGVIGHNYVEKKGSCQYELCAISDTDVKLRTLIEQRYVSIDTFQNWIDCKHQMYVRQVGEVTLPFPDEDC